MSRAAKLLDKVKRNESKAGKKIISSLYKALKDMNFAAQEYTNKVANTPSAGALEDHMPDMMKMIDKVAADDSGVKD